jgi:transcriptional regulator with XRE-family HTH domain
MTKIRSTTKVQKRQAKPPRAFLEDVEDDRSPRWAQRLKERRMTLGKSQEDLVSQSQNILNQTVISRLERGVSQPFETLSLKELLAYLSALELRLDDFIKLTGLEVPFETLEQAEKLVIKRFKIEDEQVVLYPTSPAHPPLVLQHEDDAKILGRVIWRGG